jgi:signal transduction histidine kinase
MDEETLSEVVHHLRSPLANIKIAAQLLRTIPEAKYLDLIEQECAEGLQLVENLLALYRCGDRPFVLQPIQLQFWLERMIAAIAPKLESRCLNVELDCQVSEIVGDAEILGQVVRELLHNACKYAPPNSLIEITASAERIRIANEGDLPPEVLPRLFDRFYRVPGGDPWNQGGSGLGLAMAQEMLTRMDAAIVVGSFAGCVIFEIQLHI